MIIFDQPTLQYEQRWTWSDAWRLPICRPEKTNFHPLTIAVIEAARKVTCEIGASVLTSDVSSMPTGLFVPACDS
jgi:hypothetical protein